MNLENRTIYLYDDDIGRVEYVDHMGSDITVVNSARVSFGVQKDEIDDRDKRLINYLVGHRHTSTLEHSLITFRFVVPLFIRSQHHRHRTWSYNEISRRYTDVDLQFYSPKEYREQSKSNRQASTSETFIPQKYVASLDMHMNLVSAVNAHHKDSLLLYNNLLDAGASREQARGILPQNLYTQYYGTANLNNILKFIGLRKHEGAQWEMQKVANAVLQICEQLYPITVNAWKKCTNTSSDTTKLS